MCQALYQQVSHFKAMHLYPVLMTPRQRARAFANNEFIRCRRSNTTRNLRSPLLTKRHGGRNERDVQLQYGPLFYHDFALIGFEDLVNDTYACENDKMLNDILKREFGFQGCAQN